MVIEGIVVAVLAAIGSFLWWLENSTRPFSITGKVLRKEVRWVYLSFFSPFPGRPTELCSLLVEIGPGGAEGRGRVMVGPNFFETIKEEQSLGLICRRGGITGRLKVLAVDIP